MIHLDLVTMKVSWYSVCLASSCLFLSITVTLFPLVDARLLHCLLWYVFSLHSYIAQVFMLVQLSCLWVYWACCLWSVSYGLLPPHVIFCWHWGVLTCLFMLVINTRKWDHLALIVFVTCTLQLLSLWLSVPFPTMVPCVCSPPSSHCATAVIL